MDAFEKPQTSPFEEIGKTQDICTSIKCYQICCNDELLHLSKCRNLDTIQRNLTISGAAKQRIEHHLTSMLSSKGQPDLFPCKAHSKVFLAIPHPPALLEVPLEQKGQEAASEALQMPQSIKSKWRTGEGNEEEEAVWLLLVCMVFDFFFSSTTICQPRSKNLGNGTCE